MRQGTLGLLCVASMLLGGCGGSTRSSASTRSHASASSATTPRLTAPGRSPACSDPAGICAPVHSPGIATRPINAPYASSIEAALQITRRNELAASLYNLLHGHHQRVSTPTCRQGAVFRCSVWVTPIREQLSIAIACKQRGAGSAARVYCTTRPLDFLPVHVGDMALPGIRAIVARHGYALANVDCDDPWGAPRRILDHTGLSRIYHCYLWLARQGHPIFRARAVLALQLGLNRGGWQIHVLDTPGGLRGAGSPGAPQA